MRIHLEKFRTIMAVNNLIVFKEIKNVPFIAPNKVTMKKSSECFQQKFPIFVLYLGFCMIIRFACALSLKSKFCC